LSRSREKECETIRDYNKEIQTRSRSNVDGLLRERAKPKQTKKEETKEIHL